MGENQKEWQRLEKVAYDYLDSLDLKTIIVTCPDSEIYSLMCHIESLYDKNFCEKYNLDVKDECIFNRINCDDFEAYLYNRYKDEVKIDYIEKRYIYFKK